MKVSPDGKWLAVGSHDNFIRMYDTAAWKMAG
jgi:WD40 repeat protein